MVLLRKLLRDNEIDIGRWPTDRVREVRDQSHAVQEIPPVHLDTLYKKDELYRVWLQFFNDVLPEGYC
jgi:hypothetical protein